jgi:hypothetical protein
VARAEPEDQEEDEDVVDALAVQQLVELHVAAVCQLFRDRFREKHPCCRRDGFFMFHRKQVRHFSLLLLFLFYCKQVGLSLLLFPFSAAFEVCFSFAVLPIAS